MDQRGYLLIYFGQLKKLLIFLIKGMISLTTGIVYGVTVVAVAHVNIKLFNKVAFVFKRHLF